MIRRRGASALILAAAAGLAACGSSSSHSATPTTVTTTPASSTTTVAPSTTSVSTTATTATTATAAAGSPPSTSTATAVNEVVTNAIRAQLVAAGAASHGLTAADFTGLAPGDTFYAFDPATNTYWAGAALDPSPNSTQAQVSTQDDGGYLLFHRPAGGTWLVDDDGLSGIGGTPCPITVPPAIVALWGWSPGTCRPADT